MMVFYINFSAEKNYYDPNIQSYSPDYIEQLWARAESTMRVKKSNKWKKYYDSFSTGGGRKKELGDAKIRESFFSTLYGSVTDAYNLYKIILQEKELEKSYTNPAVGDGNESIIGANTSNPSLDF